MKLVAEYPVRLVCRTLAYPRSRYYYQAKERDDQALSEVDPILWTGIGAC